MSKYDSLWEWIKQHQTTDFELSFSKIEEILSFPIDHSFLTAKKDLIPYGFAVKKISRKEKIVRFEKV